MKPWVSPNYEGRSPWTAESCLNGQTLARKTAAWIEANPKTFNELYRIVKGLQAQGAQGRIRDRVVAEAMRRGLKFDDAGFRFANGLWAGLSRYMVYADDSLMDNPIRFSRSDIDNYGLEPCTFEVSYFTYKRRVSKDER